MAKGRAIETEYRGYKFRSRLEARWAVLFDAMGIQRQYEPRGFVLNDGTCYLPDFRLTGVRSRRGGAYAGATLWVEVKGEMDDDSLHKIKEFSKWFLVPWGSPEYTEAEYEAVPDEIYGDGFIVVGDLPSDCNSFQGLSHTALDAYKQNGFYDNYSWIDGDEWPCFFVIYEDGKPGLDDCYCNCHRDEIRTKYNHVDEDATLTAYKRAKQARFEHGEHPPEGPVWRCRPNP